MLNCLKWWYMLLHKCISPIRFYVLFILIPEPAELMPSNIFGYKIAFLLKMAAILNLKRLENCLNMYNTSRNISHHIVRAYIIITNPKMQVCSHYGGMNWKQKWKWRPFWISRWPPKGIHENLRRLLFFLSIDISLI